MRLSLCATLLLAPVASALRISSTFSRRDILLSSPVLLAGARGATAASRQPPTDFSVMAEPTRPYSHYIENAAKLADNLVWYANGVDRQVGTALDGQMYSGKTRTHAQLQAPAVRLSRA